MGRDTIDISGWTIYAVDAHSLIFQVFHALPEMTSPRGEPVGAVFGFARDMLYLIDEKRPDAILCAFDRSGPVFRHELYPEYKADRIEMPEGLASQIPKIEALLDALGVPVWSAEGYEADDVLATVARICDEQGANCLIVTGDKDCRQLISDHVSVYNIRKDQVLDEAGLADDWGIKPAQVVDFQALVGDKIDNIPGVPLIGPKIARELLTTYGTLDEVLDHANEVKGAKRSQNLREYREQALISRQLVTLDRHVAIEPDWQATRVGGFDRERLAELCAEFGFRTLRDRFSQFSQSEAPDDWKTDYRLVDTPAALAQLVADMSGQEQISLDTETTHLLPRWADIVGYSFAWRPTEAYYVPVRGPAGDRFLDPDETLQALRPVLENPQIRKVGQNLKYDLVVLRAAGVEVKGTAFDTMVASYLLDAGERIHNLDDLAKRYLNHTNTKISQLIGTGRQQKRMDEVPVADVCHYAAEDADVSLRLVGLLDTRLKAAELDELFDSLEIPLIEVLVELESNGIRVDPVRLQELSTRYGQRLDALSAEIEELAGHPLNIASPKQLAEVLFQELQLPVVKKTKTGSSTDASVLEELAELHPLPAKIIEHRQFAKLKNTYVDALPHLIHPETGRVHASFNQVVAATGRLSSSDPNLQNIPIRSEEGREIRSAFVAGQEGWKLLAADYSQIELRVLAHFSQDEVLCRAFDEDLDIHTLVASEVFHVPAEEVTPAMRRRAKAVNFGVVYGQSPFGLAKSLRIDQAEAAQFIEGYFERFQGVEEFMFRTLAECREGGYVKTILGRRRAIQGVRSPDVFSDPDQVAKRRQLNLPERTAVNTVIQGSAADLIKLAMVAIHRRLESEQIPARMLLQIHDELVFEVAETHVDTLAALVDGEMTSVLPLAVPLKVDVKYGDNWAECEPWEATPGERSPQRGQLGLPF